VDFPGQRREDRVTAAEARELASVEVGGYPMAAGKLAGDEMTPVIPV
jgi:hypothetical protein